MFSLFTQDRVLPFKSGLALLEPLESRRLLACGCGAPVSQITDFDTQGPFIHSDARYDESGSDYGFAMLRSVRPDSEAESEREEPEEDCECTPDHPGFQPRPIEVLGVGSNPPFHQGPGELDPDMYTGQSGSSWLSLNSYYYETWLRYHWVDSGYGGNWGPWGGVAGIDKDEVVTYSHTTSINKEIGVNLPGDAGNLKVSTIKETNASATTTISALTLGPECATRYKVTPLFLEVEVFEKRYRMDGLWSPLSVPDYEEVSVSTHHRLGVVSYRVERQKATCEEPDEQPDTPAPNPQDPSDPGEKDREAEEDGVFAPRSTRSSSPFSQSLVASTLVFAVPTNANVFGQLPAASEMNHARCVTHLILGSET